MAVDNTAWVTGAGTGIGRELVKRLAANGWQVTASSRTQEDLESLADEAPGVRPYVLDVTDAEAVTRAVMAIGRVDLAIFSAGTFLPITAETFKVDAFAGTIDVNLMGTVKCLAAIMPSMIERRSGRLVVIASVAGFVGLPSSTAYGASKAALNNLCEALQPDLARHGVIMTVVNPGFVDTPLTRKNDFPMPFLMSVEDAADAIMKGLNNPKRFEIVFPWQMALATKFLKLLPHGLLFAITRKMVR